MRALPAPLALAACLLISACLPQPPVEPEGSRAVAEAAWNHHRQQLQSFDGFSLQGRLAVKGGGLSGSLRWRQDGEHFNLRLSGPLGAGALLLDGDARQVAIKGKDLDLVTDQPEQILAARTGWLLPLQALRWWVLGIPAPEAEASVQLDARGRVLGFRQLGWDLAFSDYREGDPALPGRIEARRGESLALLVVEKLSLGQPP